MNILDLVGLTALRRAKAAPAAVPWTQRAFPPRPVPAARPAPYLRVIRFALPALVLGGVLLWSAPADARELAVLVKNTGQPVAGSFAHFGSPRERLAQAFTTGDSSSVRLGDVGIRLDLITDTAKAASKLTLEIYEESGNKPGALHCTLSHPTMSNHPLWPTCLLPSVPLQIRVVRH